MNIFETYTCLRDQGHVTDQYSFDRSWLGMKPGYYAYLKSTNTQPSIYVLMRLHFRLLDEEQKEARWGLNTGLLSGLAEQAIDEVKGRCTQ